MKLVWLVSATVALLGAAINVPFAIEGYTLNIIAVVYCGALAVFQYALARISR